jgi:cytochrome P450
VIMFGAIETIQASIMNTLLLLLQYPEQLAAVRDDAALLMAAGEEARRLIPPVSFAERWTRQPVLVGGVSIPAGEFIGVSILAANRDPETFEDPARFDIRRKNSARALVFSFGPHTCLGLHIARLETSIALGEILARLPGLRLTAHEPPSGFAFRRPAVMHLAWDNGKEPG